MGIASRVVKKVGYENFPDGPGNQETAILASGGRSWTRMKLARDMIQNGHCSSDADELKVVKEFGGGSCGEHRRVSAATLRQTHRTLPVIQVRDSNQDHNYVIVGDWRDRTVGDHAVVVDPWPMLKKVHTYGERINTERPIPLITTPPGAADQDSAMAEALAAVPAEASRMDRFTKMRVRRPAGPEAAKAIIQGLRANGSSWDEATSTNNVHREYVSPDGEVSAFNETTRKYIREYLDAKDELNGLPDPDY